MHISKAGEGYMLPLPAAIIAVLLPVAPSFSQPVWRYVQGLLGVVHRLWRSITGRGFTS